MSFLSRYVHDEDCEKRLEWPGLRELSRREERCMHAGCIEEGISREGYHPDQCFHGCWCRERQQRARRLRREQLFMRLGKPLEQSVFKMSRGEDSDDDS